jgi:hypothetical protein
MRNFGEVNDWLMEVTGTALSNYIGELFAKHSNASVCSPQFDPIPRN